MDNFTKAYIEAALWSSNDESDESGGEPLDRNYGPEDIAPDTLAEMIADCENFQTANVDWLQPEYCLTSYPVDQQAGHDFWLTRNGHGCGFWETYDWAEPASSKLTDSAHSFGEFNLYVGDDGLIYGD